MENEEENKKIKTVLICVLAVLSIIILSMCGIHACKIYNNNYLAKQHMKELEKTKTQNVIQNNTENNAQNIVLNETNIAENIISNEENTVQEIETKNEKNKTKLPIYSEEAKEKMKNIYNQEEKVAYLTFDDGPSTAVTPLILDLLKKEDIKATFFLLGRNVKLYPDLVKREYEEGHYLANHGYTHEYSKIYKSKQAVLDEYNKCEKAIQEALEMPEYSSHLFRFPGGSVGGKYSKLKSSAKAFLNENDISYIDWNALSRDAEGTPTKKSLVESIKETTKGKNCVVILMHDAAAKILTYETLPEVISYLREQGYRFDNFYSIMK